MIVLVGIYSHQDGMFFNPLQIKLRAAPRKYQLDLEIAKKSNFSKLAQNEALRALVNKTLF